MSCSETIQFRALLQSHSRNGPQLLIAELEEPPVSVEALTPVPSAL